MELRYRLIQVWLLIYCEFHTDKNSCTLQQRASASFNSTFLVDWEDSGSAPATSNSDAVALGIQFFSATVEYNFKKVCCNQLTANIESQSRLSEPKQNICTLLKG